MATSASFLTVFYANRSLSSQNSSSPVSIFSTSFALPPKKLTSHFSKNPHSSSQASQAIPTQTVDNFVSRYGLKEPRKGADILVEALERQGVDTVFAYPGAASVEIHHALTLSSTIRTVLPRHEQGGIFAAEGYARSTGKPSVCIATSGPGATNLVTGLADALFDSIPLVVITGQVPRNMIGSNAFQETPIVEVTRTITKHNYLVTHVKDIPRIMEEAFFIATSGRPGPVLIDVPMDIQKEIIIPDWEQPMKLERYLSRMPKPPERSQLETIIRMISESRKPVLYVGGGCMSSSDELVKFVELTRIPVASTLMGLGAYPCNDDLSLGMLGMYGTVYANNSVDESDLLLAFGVRFDDHVTGTKVESFASRAKIVHIDIDSTEIGKNKTPHVSIWGDIKLALKEMNKILEKKREIDHFEVWRKELKEKKDNFPLKFKTLGEDIPPQYAIQLLDELSNGNAIITTGVGQHQMWAAQFYKYKKPRQFLTSGGLGAMGFGLPAAMGAVIANPNVIVVDIDGDGSFMMNLQELATIKAENLPVKILILNNQQLGMVSQWEDRFCKGKRAHTLLGDPSKENEIFPDFLCYAQGSNIPGKRVSKKEELKSAIHMMLTTPGPYLLDVIVSRQEHVLPVIPTGGTFKDVITE